MGVSYKIICHNLLVHVDRASQISLDDLLLVVAAVDIHDGLLIQPVHQRLHVLPDGGGKDRALIQANKAMLHQVLHSIVQVGVELEICSYDRHWGLINIRNNLRHS